MTGAPTRKPPKYYKVKVVMKDGFKYSYACFGKNLQGMMQSSNGFWTKTVTSEEITMEEYRAYYDVSIEDAPKKTRKKK